MGCRSSYLWLVGLALLLHGTAAHAVNPKVNLKLENVGPDEAIKRLSDASGVALSVYGSPGQAQNNGPRDAKVSFDWQGVTFAKALRQLCDKFLYQLSRGPSGYTLHPSFQPPAGAPLKRTGQFEKNGVKMYVRAASVNDYRRTDFVGGNNNGSGSLNLELACELGEGDGELIAGITNASGRDDMGNVLSFEGQQGFTGGYNSATYPDEWLGSLNLPAPHSRAKKLQWVEGDVMGYRSLKPFRVEVALPLAGKVVRKDVGDLIIVTSRFRAAGNDGGDDDAVEGLPNQPFRAQAGGSSVRVRIYTPQAGSRIGARQGAGSWSIQPYLVGTNGKVYTCNRTQSSGWGDPQFSVNDSTFVFPPTEDAPVKLVWDLVERSEPVKLFSFKLTDIPLPEPNVPGFRKPGGPRTPKPSPATDHPFYEKDGGTLLNRVQLGDKPAEGSLQIGLAARAGADWGPTRWIELDLDEGVARLEGLKPGSYRLQRIFRPKEGETGPQGGTWLSKDLVITAVAGKELAPAPLKWSLQPVAPPKSPMKAATIKRPGK